MQRIRSTLAGLRQPDVWTVLLICAGVGFELINALAAGAFSSFLPGFYRILWLGLGGLYVIRLWRECRSGGMRRCLGFFAICDLLALLSAFVLGFGFNLLAFSTVRLFQLIVHFEKQDNISHTKIFLDVLKDRKPELTLTFFLSVVSLLLVSSLFFLVEKPYHGETGNIHTFFQWSLGVLLGTDLFVSIEPKTGLGFLLYLLMVFLGIAVIALPISILSGGFADAISESTKLKKTFANRSNLDRAFETMQTIPERHLVASLGLVARRKYMTVDYALTRMGLTAEHISDIVATGGGYRLKAVGRELDSPYEDLLIIERFEANSPYGSFIPRSSRIHILSTQSAGDVYTGHFTATLAATIGANYYSNEYFSSGDPLPERQCNFAHNDSYVYTEASSGNFALDQFMLDLRSNVKPGDFVFYVGTCRANVQEFHIVGGGDKGVDDAAIADPTLRDTGKLADFRTSLVTALPDDNFKVCGSEVYQTKTPNHLARFIHNDLKADCIIAFVNIRILRHAGIEQYYGSIKALATAVLKTTEPLEGQLQAS